ncbi:hypothetical protein HPB49_003645 [Dermacentor silvarum]|uniref:Uncharacterized protein n=1 Tax=Dermacentor silvarum TaxID=543639 RepID=A0ACB8C762_DERSI|nr:hypothetical protein HPB49_003645 [Dermacentor silvarum]
MMSGSMQVREASLHCLGILGPIEWHLPCLSTAHWNPISGMVDEPTKGCRHISYAIIFRTMERYLSHPDAKLSRVACQVLKCALATPAGFSFASQHGQAEDMEDTFAFLHPFVPSQCGHPDWQSFTSEFTAEFTTVDYKFKLKAELDRRTQHPAETLKQLIHVIAEYYDRIAEPASDAEKVERVRRQMRATFQDLTVSASFANLQEMVKALSWNALGIACAPATTAYCTRAWCR